MRAFCAKHYCWCWDQQVFFFFWHETISRIYLQFPEDLTVFTVFLHIVRSKFTIIYKLSVKLCASSQSALRFREILEKNWFYNIFLNEKFKQAFAISVSFTCHNNIVPCNFVLSGICWNTPLDLVFPDKVIE